MTKGERNSQRNYKDSNKGGDWTKKGDQLKFKAHK
jgi:hypothetical protein